MKPIFTNSSSIVRAIICCLFISLTASSCSAKPTPRTEQSLANKTLVIYNSNDIISQNLAEYYAKKRHIPAAQVVGLPCSSAEEISRQQYDQELAEPLRKLFSARGWWKLANDETSPLGKRVVSNRIRFIALIRGIPLKIRQLANGEKYEGDFPEGGPPQITDKNEAAVDSELATLGYFTRTISGALKNPYYHSAQTIQAAKLPMLMLVCRLDGPTSQSVRDMIDHSLTAEKNGLWGFAYIDERGLGASNPLFLGDQWLANAAKCTAQSGFPTIIDKQPETFPLAYPMRDVAIYYGWYSENVCGPFLMPGFHFATGGIAIHIHSFSALSLRDPTKNWVAPLIYRGCAATIGNVYEPYLAFTPEIDAFQRKIGDGFTFAESAYASLRALSWMTTIVGDPLYRPFLALDAPANDERNPARAPSPEWATLRKAELAWNDENPKTSAHIFEKAAAKLHSGLLYEALGLREESAGENSAAQRAFEKAEKFYAPANDRVRCVIHQVRLWQSLGDKDRALAVSRKAIAKYPTASATTVLREIALKLSPPPPTPQPLNHAPR